ncbi:MAG: sulfurtransferase [Chitinophagales bacterium]
MTYSTLISAQELNANMSDENWVIIDCRFSLADTEYGKNAYHQSHIPNALYAHLDKDLSSPIIPQKTGRHPLPSTEKIVEMFSNWGISNDTQVVVYDDKGGGIAARLWWMLQWLGHEKVAVLDGAWQHWLAANYPTTAIITPPKRRVFTPKLQAERMVALDFVEKTVEGNDYLLIDSRAAERYRGEVEPIDFRAGHIPTAINAPFAENLGVDGLFLSKLQLQQRFDDLQAGIPSENTIFYCGSGVTACHNLLALKHAGLGNGKLYIGSWSEWINHHDD